MVSEASFLSSGFGTYTEILKRLHSTNKYHIANLPAMVKLMILKIRIFIGDIMLML